LLKRRNDALEERFANGQKFRPGDMAGLYRGFSSRVGCSVLELKGSAAGGSMFGRFFDVVQVHMPGSVAGAEVSELALAPVRASTLFTPKETWTMMWGESVTISRHVIVRYYQRQLARYEVITPETMRRLYQQVANAIDIGMMMNRAINELSTMEKTELVDVMIPFADGMGCVSGMSATITESDPWENMVVSQFEYIG
jgi:hypothetical protein